jgi:hypothetical protein
MAGMLQHLAVSRAYKRLIYIVFIWTCVCVLVFKMGVTNPQNKNGFFSIDLGDPNESNGVDSRQALAVEDSNSVRILLQNDYTLLSTRTRDSPVNSPTSTRVNRRKFGTSGTSQHVQSRQLDGDESQDVFELRPLVDNSKSPSEPDFLAQLAQFAYKADHAFVRSSSLSFASNQTDSIQVKLSNESTHTTSSHIPDDQQPSHVKIPELNRNHNLPLEDWPRMKHLKFKMASSNSDKCTLDYPSLYDIRFNNVYWQVLRGYGPPGPKPTGAGVPTAAAQNSSSSSSSTTPSSEKSSTDPQSCGGVEANFYLYNAYYDNRSKAGPMANVRILSMIDRVQPPQVTCLLWYPQLSQPVITSATYTYIWYGKWGNYKDGILQPYLINCRVPRLQTSSGRLQAPSSVSLALDRCAKLTNNLRVINGQPNGGKGDFAVCVKGLDFLHQDLSVRLVEWLELLRLLGAQKVFLYQLEAHPNITKVLQHYATQGFVELTKLTLPGDQPNLPGFRHLYLKNRITAKRQNELIPYNDCLYRNLNTFRYVTLLDIDEVIMPRGHNTWHELMSEVEQLSLKEHNYTRASYNVRNVYFLDDLVGLDKSTAKQHEQHREPGIPPYMHMLNHVYRSRNYTKPGQYVKCFHNTERVLSLHNHFPLNCFGYCTTYSVGTDQAQLQHYRKDCVGPLRNACNSDFRAHTVRDTTIWRYKEPLIDRVTSVLKRLHFFAPN